MFTYLWMNRKNTRKVPGDATNYFVTNVPSLVGFKNSTNHHKRERIFSIYSQDIYTEHFSWVET